MYTITGKEFKNMCRGAGLRLEDVAAKADVANTSASEWYNKEDRDINLSTYNKLVEAYDKLKEAEDD